MKLNLDRKQRAFKAEEITYLDRKTIQLDRMLLNFFELLRYDGHPAVRRRRKQIDVESLVALIASAEGRFEGFAEQPDVTRAWLVGDLLEMINRGKPDREAVVGPRPFHLNAFKLANPKYMADYGASMQVWAMLFHADRPLISRLKTFFGHGLDPATDRYDGATPLDLETLAVLGLVDQVAMDHSSTPGRDPIAPLCLGQGRTLADDLRRLLAYEGAVPRHVLANYVRITLALHLSLLQLRLFRLVPDWVARAQRGDAPPQCGAETGDELDRHCCPYAFEIVVDLIEDPNGPTAALARTSATEHIDGISAYVRAVILLNRVKDFSEMLAARGQRESVKTVRDLLAIVADPPDSMDGFFGARITDAIALDKDEELDPIAQSILRLGDNMSQLEQYVELVCLARLKDERNRLIHLLDSLSEKNKPGGFLHQTSGARSPRWFVLGSRLLETLVQLAVVERAADGAVRARPILIDEFVGWLHDRYGFVIYAPAHRPVPPEEQAAWRANEKALRERLHQIGFFTDLSDAYNSQTLRPRYEVRTDA